MITPGDLLPGNPRSRSPKKHHRGRAVRDENAARQCGLGGPRHVVKPPDNFGLLKSSCEPLARPIPSLAALVRCAERQDLYALRLTDVSGMQKASSGTTLLYDGDCRICTTFARWVAALDLRHALRIRTIQASKELLQGLPGDEILDAMHVLTPDGRRLTGGEALPALLSGLAGAPALETLIIRSSLVYAAMRRLYSVLAEFRGHLTCRFDGAPASSAARTPR